VDDALSRYLAVKQVLSGRNTDGQRTHPGIGDPDVISLAQGNGMRRPHPAVILAGVQSLLQVTQGSVDTYWSHLRDTALDEAISDLFRKLGIPTNIAANICVESGATRLLAGFFYATACPGDVFLVGKAFYHGFASLAAACHVQLRLIDTSSEDGHLITGSNLRAALAREPAARGVILTTPSFTGEIYEQRNLQELARALDETDLVVFCDMTFAFTEHDTDFFRPALSAMTGMERRTVTAMSGSKAFGLANVRIGWACGPEGIIQKMNFFATATGLTVPAPAKVMALASLRAPFEYLAQNAKEACDRKRLVIRCIEIINQQLASLDLPKPCQLRIPRIPRACHSILISFDDLAGLDTDFGRLATSIDLTRYFLQEARVAISPAYSGGIDGIVARISYGDVGADASYAASAQAERRIVDAWCRGEICTDCDLDRQLHEGFATGRALLREALCNRIGKALLHLIAANSEQLNAHVLSSAEQTIEASA
jgi:aspartate aminotransferase